MIFSVTDTGIGIAAEHHGSIFEDFVQVDSPLQKQACAAPAWACRLSQQVGRAPRGGCRDEERGGRRFDVLGADSDSFSKRWRRRPPCRACVLPEKGSRMSTELKSPRLLVVDDNPATLYATSRVLRGAGWDVLRGRKWDRRR